MAVFDSFSQSDIGGEASGRGAAQAVSVAGDDLEELLLVGLTKSGGVSGGSKRRLWSSVDMPSICTMVWLDVF
jgi:hypothetical protein